MTDRLAAIRARHDDFEARYSPGPDWEPYNQTHQDRAWLLERVAELAGALERAAETFEDMEKAPGDFTSPAWDGLTVAQREMWRRIVEIAWGRR